MRPLYELVSCGHYAVDHCHKHVDGNYPITQDRKVYFEHEVFVNQSAVIRPAQFKTEIAIIEADKPEYTFDIGNINIRRYRILIRAFVDTKITFPAGTVFCGRVLQTSKTIEIKKDSEIIIFLTGSKEESHFLALVDIPGFNADGSIIEQAVDSVKDLIDDILAQAMAYTDDEVAKVKDEILDEVDDMIDDVKSDLTDKIENVEAELSAKIDDIEATFISGVTYLKSEIEEGDEKTLTDAKAYTDQLLHDYKMFNQAHAHEKMSGLVDAMKTAEAEIKGMISDAEAERIKVDKWLNQKIKAIEAVDIAAVKDKVEAVSGVQSSISGIINTVASYINVKPGEIAIGKSPLRLVINNDGVYKDTTDEDNKLLQYADLDTIVLDDGTW